MHPWRVDNTLKCLVELWSLRYFLNALSFSIPCFIIEVLKGDAMNLTVIQYRIMLYNLTFIQFSV